MRLIRVRSEGRDGKTGNIYLATALVDTVANPAENIAALGLPAVGDRAALRDLKTTLGMELLRTKTPEMARKELAMFVIAYNALRWLMVQASVLEGWTCGV